MRKITSLVAALLLSVATFAQAPQGFSYQAVVRDAQNALVANQTVDVTLTITAEVGGVAAQSYTEKHSVTTNANGLFTLVVGQGESSQKLSDIKWNVPGAVYNLRTETAYGTATTQLMSVPFALYAEQAGELDYQKLAKTLTSDDVQAVLGYVKAEQLADYAKKSDIPAGANLDNYVLNDSLVLLIANVEATYAKKSDIPAPTDLSGYAKTADVEATYAKKSDIQAAADMSGYVKADTLSQYALNSSLTSYISKETFADYILSGGKIESVDLTVYAKTADVDATYAKKSDIPAATDLSGYAKTADVASAYVTKETFDAYVLSGGQADSVDLTVFAKTADVAATYAKKSDIPAPADLSGYAKNDTLSQYALNTSLASYVTKEAFDAYVLSGGQADSVDLTVFAKTADVEKTYAKKSDIPAPADLSVYAKAADVVSKETFANYILGAGNPDAADLSVYAKTADVASTYVTKEAFDNYVSNGGQADSVDLSAYAKTADVEATYAKKSELPEMDNYVTVKDLNDTLGYYLTSEANGQALLGWFYTKSDVDALISDKVTDSALQSVTDQFLTKETFDAYVLSGGQADSVDLTVYAKTADVAATYAKKSDIPAAVNLGNYVTKDSLNILVEHQSLADYAKTSDLAGYAVAADVNSEFAFQNHYNDSVYLRKANADYTYAKRSDVAYTIGYVNDSIDFYYAKKADVASTYVTKETFDNYVLSGGQADSVDLTVYAKTADVAATYAKKSDIPAAVNLSNYVVKDSLNILVEHQSLAAYATTAKLSDTLAAYAKTADLSAKANTADLATVATSGSYNDLTNSPTGLSAFENDTEYVTASEMEAQGYLTEHQSLAAYATKANLNDTLADYAKTADLATVATTGSYNDLINKPDFATKSEFETLQKTVKTNFGNELAVANNDVVDLGLSSGNLWATCNLGASSPSEGGGFYAWGETETKSEYTWSTYEYGDSESTITKYCTLSQFGDVDNLTTLEVADDAAAANLGKGWVMPTIDEWNELYDQCYWELTTDYNGTGKGGYIVYKSADKTLDKQQTKASNHTYSITTDEHIFLPLAGYIATNNAFQGFNYGWYWSSTVGGSSSCAEVARLWRENSIVTTNFQYSRAAGLLVRAIRRADATILSNYATLAQLQAQVAALQETMAQLTKNANQIGDMPLANVTVKVVYANDYSGSTDIATVSFLGKTLKSGETTFKVPAYSPAFLSVALSTFNVSNKYYTYTVKVNGEYFDNLAYEYEVANENVYNSGNVSTFNYNTSFCKSSLSNIKIGSKEKDDTYNNRAFYQDPKYIYVDVVDAIQDIDLNDGRPKHQSGYTDMEYFENRLLIGVTNAQYNDSYGDQYLVQLYNGGDASPRIGVKPRWYRWSDKTWNPTDDYNEWEAAMGLVHMSNYNQSATFIKPIYAKVPNFIYKNTFTTKTVYKVGTESGTGLGRNGLNANMNNQVVGPFNQTNNTIVIEVSSYTVVN